MTIVVVQTTSNHEQPRCERGGTFAGWCRWTSLPVL
jgi:hypothetical protein